MHSPTRGGGGGAGAGAGDEPLRIDRNMDMQDFIRLEHESMKKEMELL